nr:hypothetical protein [Bradyrhizobium sp. WSM1253]
MYAFVTLAALLRVFSPLAGAQTMRIMWLAGASWTALSRDRRIDAPLNSPIQSATGELV